MASPSYPQVKEDTENCHKFTWLSTQVTSTYNAHSIIRVSLFVKVVMDVNRIKLDHHVDKHAVQRIEPPSLSASVQLV